jgi:serine/threonine protein kinase
MLVLKGKYGEYQYVKEAEYCLNKKGKLSSVYTGICLKDNRKVVIKEVNLKRSLERSDILISESRYSFRHENLIQTYDCIVQRNRLFIVREYAPGMDMKTFLSKRKFRRKADIRFALECGVQVCNALEFLHQNKIIHCDIKPSNIIINIESKDAAPDVKLIDYGMSSDMSRMNHLVEKQSFALMYSPPEQLLKIYSHINETTDLYSLCVTLYEFITRENPYYSDNPLKIMALQMVYPLPEHRKIPGDLLEILRKATYKYPLKKPPHKYKQDELTGFISEAQKQRYQSAGELKNALSEILNK